MMKLRNMLRGLENDVPAKALLQYWNHDEGTLGFWRASSNFVYIFDTGGKRHYLRFVHEEDNTTEQIQAELDFVQYLVAEGYPAAAPVRSRNNRWIEGVRTGNGTYHGVVFEQARGEHLPAEGMKLHHYEQCGRSLASLHLLSQSYRPQKTVRRSWNDALSFVSSVLDRHPREVGARNELKRLYDELSQLPVDESNTGLIHYDFETDNLFYMPDKAQYSTIDFDDAMRHWYMMDITNTASDIIAQDDDGSGEKLARFLAGYRAVKPLDEREMEWMPLFQRFKNLYSFARVLYSTADIGTDSPPEWVVQLKDKLLLDCERRRSDYMPQVELKPVQGDNWYACSQLEVSTAQQPFFPVPAVYWLAEAAYCGWTPLALYSGEQLIGLSVYAVDPDDGSYWIMALMIDQKHQHNGLGLAGMQALITFITERHGCDRIRLGHRSENDRAARLYASLGFNVVEQNRDEVIRELALQKQ